MMNVLSTNEIIVIFTNWLLTMISGMRFFSQRNSCRRRMYVILRETFIVALNSCERSPPVFALDSRPDLERLALECRFVRVVALRFVIDISSTRYGPEGRS